MKKLKSTYRSLLMIAGLIASLGIISGSASAQTGAGKISGTVTEGEPVAAANVTLYKNDVPVTGKLTDDEGKYSFSNLEPGMYMIRVIYGEKDTTISAYVGADKIASGDIDLLKVYEGPGLDIIGHTMMKPIDIDMTVVSRDFSREELNQMKIRSVNDVAALAPAVYQSDHGSPLNFRGARSNATLYVVDGIKIIGPVGMPQQAWGNISVITGGIPAEYGDTNGGVIVVTTQAPIYKFKNPEAPKRIMKKAAEQEENDDESNNLDIYKFWAGL